VNITEVYSETESFAKSGIHNLFSCLIYCFYVFLFYTLFFLEYGMKTSLQYVRIFQLK
jgi:hypothetical protein